MDLIDKNKEQVKKAINLLSTEIVHSDASDNQKENILELLGAISFMVGNAMGTVARYDALLTKHGIKER